LCALGISQLKFLEPFKRTRAINFLSYRDLLSELNLIQLPTQRSYVDPTWHLYPIQVEASNRKTIFEALRANGIGVQVNYIPANWHPVFKNKETKVGAFPNADAFYAGQISLPMHVNLTNKEKEHIAKTLIMICNSLIG
jgi:dTDP-4-amino-4,6-dideoxygalactose transaminase